MGSTTGSGVYRGVGSTTGSGVYRGVGSTTGSGVGVEAAAAAAGIAEASAPNPVGSKQ